ncbi:MAG: tetratricopeptide repeat protein [Gemmataceae bacterium]|nr:tetratricopeptide repeat protein [Gemmataceae bacterium]
MRTHQLAVPVVLAALLAATPYWTVAGEKSWVSESVVYTKPAKDIKFGDVVDGKQMYFRFSGRMPIKVRDDRDGWLRVHDGYREGWVDKADFVLARDAPAYFHRRVQANPKDTWALFMRGSGWRQKGELDNAIKDFDECIRLDATDSGAFTSRGLAWSAKKEYDRAIKDYDEAIRLDPKESAPFNGRGLAWSAKKDYDRAIRDYNEAIRLDPELAWPLYNRGNAWRDKEDYESAIRDYNEAIRLSPNYADAFRSRAYAWHATKQFDEAIKDCDKAIHLDPKSALAFLYRAFGWLAKKEYEQAINDCDAAMRLDPKWAWPHYGRSVAQMLMRRPESAGGFQRAIDVQGWKSDRAPCAVILGHLAARQAGDETGAKRFLTDSVGKLDETWPYPAIQFLRGAIDEAALLKLATDDGKRTEARCFLGLDHALKGRKDEALAHFRWVKQHGSALYVEYTIAVAELERLEKGVDNSLQAPDARRPALAEPRRSTDRPDPRDRPPARPRP